MESNKNNENSTKMNAALAKYKNILQLNYGDLISLDHIQTESWMNKINLFYKSIAFYILAFFLLAFSWMTKPRDWMLSL